MSQSALNHFDGIVYINLDKRTDRKKEIEKELEKISIDPHKIFRISANDDELNGVRGCAYSHLQALELALQKRWKNILVLEDDCLFIEDQKKIDSYINSFFHHFNNDWDVFFLGTDIRHSQRTSHKDYVRVLFSVRAHSYAVNGHYIPKLRNHFISTYESMKEDLFFTNCLHKALDRQWMDLQKIDHWLAGVKMIASQRASFIDIEKGIKSQR